MLWEIGEDPVELRELRARLDLDSGYLSRVLRALEDDGLIAVTADDLDKRVRQITLTAMGTAERRELDRLSDEQASSILERLAPRQRNQAVEAMALVSRLIDASAIEIEVTDPSSIGVRNSMAAYFAELATRFDLGFDPERSLPTHDEALRLPAGLVLLATLHGEPVGCVALKLHAGGIGEVKRMWVSPAARGLGLARRLLGRVEAEGLERGIHTLRLDTNRALIEAIALYRALGFIEVEAFNDEPYAHHWFERSIP